MVQGFQNLKDDGDRLNRHTRALLEELDEIILKWNKSGFDGRAIYAALTTYHAYYQKLGEKRMGQPYMSALFVQSEKLADELLARAKS